MSWLNTYIPARYTEAFSEALRVLDGVLHAIENASDSTNMEVITEKILRFFSCLYGPEKGWTSPSDKRPFVSTFRTSEFFRSIDSSVQKQIKKYI